MQYKSAHDHQRALRIMITMAATMRNIQLIIDMIIMPHTSVAFLTEWTLKAHRRTTVSVYWSVLSVHV